MPYIFCNKIYNAINIIYWSIVRVISTSVVSVSCTIRGIHLGKNCSFYGLPKFTRGTKTNITVGDNCTFRSMSKSNLIGIDRPCIFSAIGTGASKLTIGDNCGFSGTVIGCFDNINIGNNVKCGANTLITDSDWHEDDPRVGVARPIVIKDNVWLGVGVTVMKGVTIGTNSIIGAGSIVVKDVPDNVIVGGNPCRLIKTL